MATHGLGRFPARRVRRRVLGMLLGLPLWAGAAQADVLVIVNPGVPVSELDRTALRKIYLGKSVTWENGERIQPCIQADGATHDAFLQEYLRKSATQFDTYWKKMLFTGKGKPPRELPSDMHIVQFVARTRGAIGYVTEDPSVDDVRVLPVK